VLPSVTVRFDRDEDFIKALAESVDRFVGRLDAAKERLAGKRDEWRGQIAAAAEASSHIF
jgi:hypothetical protein